MPTDLLFLCHAPTGATRLAAFPADDPIDTTGLAKAAFSATTLPRSSAACCAPSLAARQTASACRLDPTVEEAIRDCDFGRWAGRPLSDVARDEPEAFGVWMTDASAAPHGGETLSALVGRVGGWLDQRLHAKKTTIAVTHPAVIRAAVIHAVDWSPAAFWHLDVGPLSQTWLRTDGRRWTLRGLHQFASADVR